jgi:hypothetical protein
MNGRRADVQCNHRALPTRNKNTTNTTKTTLEISNYEAHSNDVSAVDADAAPAPAPAYLAKSIVI